MAGDVIKIVEYIQHVIILEIKNKILAWQLLKHTTIQNQARTANNHLI